MINYLPRKTLRHFRGLPLSGSPNRFISDYANAPSKFLASLGTSDMPRMFGEIDDCEVIK